MGTKSLDLQTKMARIINFLAALKTGSRTKEAAKKCLVPPCSLQILVQQGFVKITGVRATLKVVEVLNMDEVSLQLVAEEIWKETNKPPSSHRTPSPPLLPVLKEALPPHLPLTVLEEVSLHVASIASIFGIQCGGKTPPGIAQAYARLQIENMELKEQVVTLRREVLNAKNSLKAVAKNMRAAAERFDGVEQKIAPESSEDNQQS